MVFDLFPVPEARQGQETGPRSGGECQRKSLGRAGMFLRVHPAGYGTLGYPKCGAESRGAGA